MIGQHELLAIKVAMQNVSQVRREVGGIRDSLAAVRSENLAATRSQEGLSRSAAAAARTVQGTAQRTTEAMHRMRRDSDGARLSFERFKGSVLSLTATFGSLYGGIRLAVGAVKAFEAQRGFQRSLAFNLGAQNASLVTRDVNRFADRQGMDKNALRSDVAQLAATDYFKSRVDELVPTLRAFTALGAAGGATGEGIAGAFRQYQQIASSGRLQGDELKIIQEWGVQLRSLLIDAGLGDRIGSSKDPINFDEIQKVLLAFGQRADVDRMLAEQAGQASASLQRFWNIINTDVIPALGQALSPTLDDVAKQLTAWAEELQPERVKAFVDSATSVGKTLVSNAPAIAGLFAGFRVYRAVLEGRMIGATVAAAASLERLAGSAAVAGTAVGMGGGPGMGFGGPTPAAQRAFSNNPGYGGGVGGFIPGVGSSPAGSGGSASSGWLGRVGRGLRGAGRFGAGIGGSLGGGIVGGAIASRFTDNPWLQAAGSIGGSVAGLYGTNALLGWLGGGGAAGVAGAAGAAALPALGAIGGGVIAGQLGLLGLAGSEALTGRLGTEDSFFTRWFLGGDGVGGFGGGFNPGNRKAWDDRQRSVNNGLSSSRSAAALRRQARQRVARQWGWKGGNLEARMTNDFMRMFAYAFLSSDELAAFGGRLSPAADFGRSPRAAAYDSATAESNGRALRWTP